jgi:hypothetical protein
MQVGESDECITSLRFVGDLAAFYIAIALAPAFVVVHDDFLLSGVETARSGGRTWQ